MTYEMIPTSNNKSTHRSKSKRRDTRSSWNGATRTGASKGIQRQVCAVEPALHRRLAAKALADGESLNSYCVKTLRKA